MIVFLGTDWREILAWNLRTAGMLWSAWAGGAVTMRRAHDSEEGSADIIHRGRIGGPEPEEEEAPPRHLFLVK